jgi:hypothetical protein
MELATITDHLICNSIWELTQMLYRFSQFKRKYMRSEEEICGIDNNMGRIGGFEETGHQRHES